MQMGQNGALKRITSSERSASALVKFAPKEVTISPGSSQTVRMQFASPTTTERGEFRSHLLVEPVSVATATETDGSSDSGLRVGINIRFAVSIPVIVRNGDLPVAAKFSTAKVENEGSKSVLMLDLDRSGGRSLRGDLVVSLLSPDGRSREVARRRGFAVYVPNESRTARLYLPEGVKGKLTVKFVETGEAKPATCATTLTVGD